MSFAASDHGHKLCQQQWELVLTDTTFYFKLPVSRILIPLNYRCLGNARSLSEGCDCARGVSWQLLPCKSSFHLHTPGTGAQGWEISSPPHNLGWSQRDAHMSACLCNFLSRAHVTAPLHHFPSLKFFMRGYLQGLCICKAHLIKSWWRKGCADVTILPAGYEGTDFPSCCAGVLSQSDLLWKNQGELKFGHWRCHHVTKSSLRVHPGSCS